MSSNKSYSEDSTDTITDDDQIQPVNQGELEICWACALGSCLSFSKYLSRNNYNVNIAQEIDNITNHYDKEICVNKEMYYEIIKNELKLNKRNPPIIINDLSTAIELAKFHPLIMVNKMYPTQMIITRVTNPTLKILFSLNVEVKDAMLSTVERQFPDQDYHAEVYLGQDLLGIHYLLNSYGAENGFDGVECYQDFYNVFSKYIFYDLYESDYESDLYIGFQTELYQTVLDMRLKIPNGGNMKKRAEM